MVKHVSELVEPLIQALLVKVLKHLVPTAGSEYEILPSEDFPLGSLQVGGQTEFDTMLSTV
jgi:hypothetical protein